MDALNDIAMDLVKLLIIIAVFMVVTIIIIGIVNRIIKLPKMLTDFLIGLSALAGTYLWFQITFM